MSRWRRPRSVVLFFSLSLCLLLLLALALLCSSTPRLLHVWPQPAPLDKLSRPQDDHTASISGAAAEVHVALLIGGPGSSASAMVTLKSILLHRQCQLHLHLVADAHAQLALAAAFVPWASALPALRWTFYDLDRYPSRVAWLPTQHRAGAIGTSKLLYDDILTLAPRVIALDTDLILHGDIAELWRYFDRFAAGQLFAAAEQQSDWYLPNNTYGHRLNLVWPARGRGLNSGVLLLALDRMREQQWQAHWPALARAQLQLQPQTGLADQDIWNLACVREPSICGTPLPCHWNLQLHDTSTSALCSANRQPGILHWNSPAKRATSRADLTAFAQFWTSVQGLAPQMLLLQAEASAPLLRGASNHSHQAAALSRATPASDPSDLPSDAPLHLSEACRVALDRARQHLRHHPFYTELSLAPRSFHCFIDRDLSSPLVVMAGTEAQAERMVKEKFSRILAQKSALHAVQCQPLAPGARPAGDPEPVFPTLVTHMSLDRFASLLRMAENWRGAIHVVFYLLDAQLPALEHMLQALVMAPPGSLVAHELVVHVAFQDDPGRAYPVNRLRNLGLDLVDRSMTKVMLDADLVPVPGSDAAVVDAMRAASGERVALVLPALESSSYESQTQHPKSAAEARHAFLSGQLSPFRMREWPRGHNATAFDVWARPGEGDDSADRRCYPVSWEPGFEPYVAVASFVPEGQALRYPEALEGFGWNKVVYTSQLHLRGYDFYVLRQAAVVHYPHAPSPDLERFRRRKRNSAEDNCNALIAQAMDPSLRTLLPMPRRERSHSAVEVQGVHGIGARDEEFDANDGDWQRVQQAAIRRARGQEP